MNENSASNTLKEVLYENLLASLSQDNHIRTNAEQQLKFMETNDEFGLHLVEISLNESISLPIRQLAAVLLKQYIQHHWTQNYENHIPPEVPPQIKATIKNVLLKSLDSPLGLPNNDSCKKLRSSLAYTVSAIAHYDWPEEWPQLGHVLIEYLSSGNTMTVYSAMKVFAELSHAMTDNQMPTVAPLLLPKMYYIFVSQHQFSLRTRGRAVQIFMALAEIIAQMDEIDQTAVQNYLEPILPQFSEALLKVLQMPDSSGEVDVGLKKDIINALTILLRNCQKRMKKWLPQILEPVWHSLTTFSSIYVKTIVNVQSCDYDGDHETFAADIDSDGEVLGFENLIFAIFDFVSVVIEVSQFRKLVKPVMSDLIYYIIHYMQITDEQAACWQENPDQFVEDEDEDSYSYSIRISALDLIMALAKEFEYNESVKKLEEFKSALLTAINKHLVESNELRKMQTPYSKCWWKIQEACQLTIGSISPMLVDTVKSTSPLADTLRSILDSALTNTTEESAFLTGRSLWTASRLAEIMNFQSIDRFLQLTTSALSSPSPVLQVAAARATWGFCDFIKNKRQTQLIKSYLRPMLEGLVAIGTRHSTEVLALVLEAIGILISVDQEFTTSVEHIVSPLAIATFLKYTSDPVLISVVQDLFAELSRNKNYVNLLQQRLVPTLVSILHPSQPSQFATLLQPSALEILSTLVKNSPIPLSDILILRGYPATISAVVNAVDDTATLQNGGECVRMFLTKSVEQVHKFNHEGTNQNGISLALQVCHRLLDPRISESSSTFVGRLTTILITKAGQYLGNENIHLLLRAVLVKLQSSETLSVIQGLVLVFAHLINYDLPTILDFLSSLPAPSGTQSALEFVLQNWLGRQHLFFGAYEKKVSFLALCKLLEHSISNTSHDKLNLNHIKVAGDALISDSPGIKTRSKTAANPIQWSQVPCSVKILKLLLAELKAFEELNEAQSNYTDEDDESEDDDQVSPSKIDPTLTGVIDDDWAEGGVDLDEDDVLNETISAVNLEMHLTNVIREFKKMPQAGEFASNLTDVEKIILNKTG